jgi:hypothetical protein
VIQSSISTTERIGAGNRCQRNEIKAILLFFVLSRLIFFALFYICQNVLGVEYQYGLLFYQYDGYHYTNLGTHGYQAEYQYAFFPLFPLIIRGFAFLGMPVAGPLLLNHVLTLGVAFMVYRLVSVDLGKGTKTGMQAALLWVFSPLSVSTCTLYSEAIFIFLTVGAYGLYLRKRAVPAGILLGLSILTRSMGAMLFASILVVEGIRLVRTRDRKRFVDTLKLLMPAGILGALYPLYLQIKVGNWHYFVDVQYEHWARAKSNLFDMIYRDFTNFSSNAITVVFTYLSLAICIWIIVLAIRGRGDWVLILYMVLTILMVFSTARDHGSIGSFSFYRYLFGCASVYLLLDARMRLRIMIPLCITMSILATAVYCMSGFLI